MSCLHGISRRQHLHGGANVDGRNYQFLEGEDDELNALVDVVDLEPHSRIGLITTERLDRSGHLKDAEVGNDHDEHRPKYTMVSNNEMQP